MSSSSSDNIVASGTYQSDKFDFVNDKLRQHVKLANKEIDNVKDKTNELVSIVHNDNRDWSLKKICEYIAGKNDDLAQYGYSARTIYNYLNEENRKLVDTSKQKGKKLENNVTEDDDESLHHNVLEDSSISDDEEPEELEPQPIIDPQLLDQKIEEIAKLQEENYELKETLQEVKKEKVETAMSKSYSDDGDIELSDDDLKDIHNNSGICPLKRTAYPEQHRITTSFDRTRLKKR